MEFFLFASGHRFSSAPPRRSNLTLPSPAPPPSRSPWILRGLGGGRPKGVRLPRVRHPGALEHPPRFPRAAQEPRLAGKVGPRRRRARARLVPFRSATSG